jgi:hypothetical protein
MPSDGERNGSVWNLCKSYDFQHPVGHVPDNHGEGVAVGSGAHGDRVSYPSWERSDLAQLYDENHL